MSRSDQGIEAESLVRRFKDIAALCRGAAADIAARLEGGSANG